MRIPCSPNARITYRLIALLSSSCPFSGSLTQSPSSRSMPFSARRATKAAGGSGRLEHPRMRVCRIGQDAQRRIDVAVVADLHRQRDPCVLGSVRMVEHRCRHKCLVRHRRRKLRHHQSSGALDLSAEQGWRQAGGHRADLRRARFPDHSLRRRQRTALCPVPAHLHSHGVPSRQARQEVGDRSANRTEGIAEICRRAIPRSAAQGQPAQRLRTPGGGQADRDAHGSLGRVRAAERLAHRSDTLPDGTAAG